MLNKDWTVKTEENEHGTCVHVHIDDAVSLEGLMFSLIDENRQIIAKMKVMMREIYLCTPIGKPMFVQLGDGVKYVDGSGCETYHIDKKKKK